MWDAVFILKEEGAPSGCATRCLQLGAMSADSVMFHPLNGYDQAHGAMTVRQDRVLAGRLVGEGRDVWDRDR